MCPKCEREQEAVKKKQDKAFELQQKREAEQKEHLRKLAQLDEKIDQKRQEVIDEQERRARELAIEQKKQDLVDAAMAAMAAKAAGRAQVPPPQQPTASSSPQAFPDQQSSHPPSSASRGPSPNKSASIPTATHHPAASTPNTAQPNAAQPNTAQPNVAQPNAASRKSGPDWVVAPSPSEKEWKRQKDFENASNKALDKLMDMTGLENVKEQVLKIKVFLSDEQLLDEIAECVSVGQN